MASKGVGYGPKGYISYRGDNTVFTFPDVPTFDSDATDSTILLIFDLIQAYKGEQAIIVSGDFIETRLEGELRIFALTVTPREKLPPKKNMSGPHPKVSALCIPKTIPAILPRFHAFGTHRVLPGIF